MLKDLLRSTFLNNFLGLRNFGGVISPWAIFLAFSSALPVRFLMLSSSVFRRVNFSLNFDRVLGSGFCLVYSGDLDFLTGLIEPKYKL